MKKLVTFLSLSLAFFANANVNSTSNSEYFLNETALETVVSSAVDVTSATLTSVSGVNGMDNAPSINGSSKPLFLVLNFFLGGLAVHRYYMGVDGAWYMVFGYACVPVAGTVATCGDFFYVLFGTSTTHEEYADNKKWFVWID